MAGVDEERQRADAIFGIAAPAVLVGIIIAALSFQRAFKFLHILAVTYSIVFIVQYFYVWQSSFLQKSIVLLITGLIAFGIYFLLTKKISPISLERSN